MSSISATAATSSSLRLLTLTPTTHSPKPSCISLSLNKPPLFTSLSSSSFSSSIKFFQASPPCRLLKLHVSSDFGVDASEDVVAQGEVSQEDEQERGGSFSPDLKIFVGNLPFTCDSATLAGLFESSGNVEMVEVHALYCIL